MDKSTLNEDRQQVINYLNNLPSDLDEKMTPEQVEQFVDKMIEDEASFESALEFANNEQQMDQLTAYSILYQIMCDK